MYPTIPGTFTPTGADSHLAEQLQLRLRRVDVDLREDRLQNAGPGGAHLSLHRERAHAAVAAAAARHNAAHVRRHRQRSCRGRRSARYRPHMQVQFSMIGAL